MLRGLAVAVATLVVAVGLLALSVEYQPLDPAYAGPAPVDPAVAERFAYPELGTPAPPLSSFEPQSGSGWSSRWIHLSVTTPGEETSHRVQVIHFQPEPLPEGSVPGVVVTPILGGKQYLARMIARSLAERGLHAAVVLKAESFFDARAPDSRLERVLRTAVVDRRRTIDWLQGLPGVDPERIGAIGVSMGGLATTLLVAVDPRVDAAVIMMAGTDLGDVIVRSEEPRLRRYVEERGLTAGDLRARVRAVLVSDPLHLAPFADARRLLLFATRRDAVIPFDRQQDLWERLGRPERYVLPTGHYSAAVYLPWALPKAVGFLEERLRRAEDESDMSGRR